MESVGARLGHAVLDACTTYVDIFVWGVCVCGGGVTLLGEGEGGVGDIIKKNVGLLWVSVLLGGCT